MAIAAVIRLDFDPLLRLADLTISWQAVGLGVTLLLALCLAALSRAETMPAPSRGARHVPGGHQGGRALPYRSGYAPGPWSTAPAPASAALGGGELIEAKPLRLDDLGYIVLAALPGAVIGGRLVHGLVFWDYYWADPWLLLEPGQGTLSLLGAVLGGSLTGAWMAWLLAAPVRRWADTAAVPLLLALGFGKLSQLLAGSGQGAPFGGAWAVAFQGEGPWISANPQMPAHPAQAYEGIWLLIAALLLLSLIASVRRQAGRQGSLFVLAICAFLLGRLLVGFTWRDEPLLPPLNAEQLLALLALGLMVAGVLAAAARRTLRRRRVEIVRDVGPLTRS